MSGYDVEHRLHDFALNTGPCGSSSNSQSGKSVGSIGSVMKR
jgi:hypothetical protein